MVQERGNGSPDPQPHLRPKESGGSLGKSLSMWFICAWGAGAQQCAPTGAWFGALPSPSEGRGAGGEV
jgi:hypothetical protein